MSSKNGVVIIAGASKGLGCELAHRACNLNYPVALIARNHENLIKIKNTLETNHPDSLVSIHATDLTNKQETQKTFNDIASTHKLIRALVNCAATWTGGKTVKQLSADDMEQSLQLNFFTAFNSIKALLDLSDDALQKPLSIINIGATASLRGSKNCSAFAVAKGALRQLSQSLARELWPQNIHVAHLIIDGLIANTRTKALNKDLKNDQFINMTSIADSILQTIQQERSCWTFEWDVRPFNENW